MGIYLIFQEKKCFIWLWLGEPNSFFQVKVQAGDIGRSRCNDE